MVVKSAAPQAKFISVTVHTVHSIPRLKVRGADCAATLVAGEK
jgi:hypothetical protein